MSTVKTRRVFLNAQVLVQSWTVPETSRNINRENQKRPEDSSQNDLHIEVNDTMIVSLTKFSCSLTLYFTFNFHWDILIDPDFQTPSVAA